MYTANNNNNTNLQTNNYPIYYEGNFINGEKSNGL
jgi:hypothetical protein